MAVGFLQPLCCRCPGAYSVAIAACGFLRASTRSTQIQTPPLPSSRSTTAFQILTIVAIAQIRAHRRCCRHPTSSLLLAASFAPASLKFSHIHPTPAAATPFLTSDLSSPLLLTPSKLWPPRLNLSNSPRRSRFRQLTQIWPLPRCSPSLGLPYTLIFQSDMHFNWVLSLKPRSQTRSGLTKPTKHDPFQICLRPYLTYQTKFDPSDLPRIT